MTKETKKPNAILSDKQLIDVSDAVKSLAEIKAFGKTGVTTTLGGYRILQKYAVNAMRHVEKHRNVNVLTDVITALTSAQIAPVKMNEFIIKFAPVSWDQKKKSYVLIDGEFNIKDAMVKPWWKSGKKEEIKNYSLEQAFTVFMSLAGKHIEKPKEGDVIDSGLYQDLNRIAKERGLFLEDDSLNEEESVEVTTEDTQEPTEPVVLSEKAA